MREGDVIANTFRLERHRAQGGMGSVFRGVDLRSGDSVAVKTWLPAWPGTEAAGSGAYLEGRAFARFEREAGVLAAIEHPAIVRYVAHGTTPAGEPYLVMHWVDGQDLAATLRQRSLGLLETLELGARLARALGVLHAHGVVHRDLKPANIVLEQADVSRAVIVDFGVARRAQFGTVTASGTRVGTPCYMAPEQIRDAREVDGRADVFALGCVLFECLAGIRAYSSNDALGAIAQILLDDPPVLRELRPELPEAVSRLVARLLCREREQRPFADPELERELAQLRELAARSDCGPPALRPSSLPPDTADPTEQPSEFVARRSEPARTPSLPAAFARRESEPPDAVRVGPALIGRDEELRELGGWLASGAGLVVVWGPAGMGKTRLAAELLARAPWNQSEAPGLFIDLGAARGLDEAFGVLAQHCGARVSGDEIPSSAIGRALGQQRGRRLIVLDAIDGVSSELEPLIAEWRARATEACFVLTSRARGRFPGAVHLELGPLEFQPENLGEGPDSVAPSRDAEASPPPLSPAAALFVECARRRQADFDAAAADAGTIERIVRALEGIPLAIELGAGRAPLLGLDGLLARVSKPIERLGALGPSSGAGSWDAMREAIRSSYEALNADERTVLEHCAVFPGPFRAESAEQAFGSNVSGRPLLDILQALREKSLIAASSAGKGRELQLHLFRTIRDYALSRLAESGREPDARARFAGYVAERARHLLESRRSQTRIQALRLTEAEADQLVSGIDYALNAPGEWLAPALDTWLALEPVVVARGALPAFVSRLDRTLVLAEQRPELAEALACARVLQLRARLSATSGRFEHAEQDLERCRAIAERHGDLRLAGSAWLELGVAHHLARRLPDAQSCYERALSLVRSQGELRTEGRCYGNLGALLHDRHRLTEAGAYYWKAIQLLEEAGEPRELANFLSNLAVLEQELGARDSARRHYEKALSLLGEAADARLRAIALGNLGALEAESGRWQHARRCHERALDLLVPLDDPVSEALCHARLGATLATLGLLREAEAELSQAQRRPPNDPARLEAVRLQRAFLDLSLARAALAERDPGEARARLQMVEARLEAVAQASHEGVPLAALSDDIRLSLRVLEPLRDALRGALTGE